MNCIEHTWKVYTYAYRVPFFFGLFSKKISQEFHSCTECGSILVEYGTKEIIVRCMFDKVRNK